MDRMSPTEALMWAVEKDPALRSDFVNLTVLDSVPDDTRLRSKVETALDAIERLTQRVVSAPLRMAPPEWVADPTLDLDYHLRKVALPAPGGDRELLDLTAMLSAAPLDRSRPLWEFTVVEGLDGDRAALVQRIHHTITDGVGALKLSLALVDLERDPTPDADEGAPARGVAAAAAASRRRDRGADTVDRLSPVDLTIDAVRDGARRQVELARRGAAAALGLAVRPDHLPGAARDGARFASSLRRQVLVTDPARSPLLAPRSLGRRFEMFSVPLEPAQRAAHALGGTLNDLYVTGVAGALGRYHDRMGAPVDELRMAMPVSTRGGSDDTGGNRFAPARVLVPLGPKDPAAHFAAVRSRLSTVRDEPAVAAADSLAGIFTMLPTSVLVSATRAQARTIDFAASNLRGSPVDLFIGGAHIDASYPMGPRSGCALNVTLLSYLGSLDLGLNLDPAAVTDPAALVDCFAESFDALLATP